MAPLAKTFPDPWFMMSCDQPWQDLFAKLPTDCTWYILKLPVGPRRGPFQNHSTEEDPFKDHLFHLINLLGACRVIWTPNNSSKILS